MLIDENNNPCLNAISEPEPALTMPEHGQLKVNPQYPLSSPEHKGLTPEHT